MDQKRSYYLLGKTYIVLLCHLPEKCVATEEKCEISGSHIGVAEDSGVLQNVRILSPGDSFTSQKTQILNFIFNGMYVLVP